MMPTEQAVDRVKAYAAQIVEFAPDMTKRDADELSADLTAVLDTLTALQARVGELEGVARLSAAQFRFYELQHRAKHTPEADAKADTNRDLAARIEALLTPPAVEGRGVRSEAIAYFEAFVKRKDEMDRMGYGLRAEEWPGFVSVMRAALTTTQSEQP